MKSDGVIIITSSVVLRPKLGDMKNQVTTYLGRQLTLDIYGCKRALVTSGIPHVNSLFFSAFNVSFSPPTLYPGDFQTVLGSLYSRSVSSLIVKGAQLPNSRGVLILARRVLSCSSTASRTALGGHNGGKGG